MTAAELSLENVTEQHAKPLPRFAVELVYRTVDLAIIAAVGLVAYLVKSIDDGELSPGRYAIAIVISVIVAAPLLDRFAGYRDERLFSRRIPVGGLITAWAITFCVLLGAGFVLKVSGMYSRAWAVSWFVGSGGALLIGRSLLGHWVQSLALSGRLASRTVILGAGAQGRRLQRFLESFGGPLTQVVGFVDDRGERVLGSTGSVPLIGDVEALLHLIRRGLVDQVMIALPWSADRRIEELVSRLRTTPVAIRLAPDLVGFAFPDRSFTSIARVPVVRLFDRPISGWSYVVKTAEDRLLALVLCFLLAPLLTLIALAVKLDSPGPVFFRQKRTGFNQQLFDCWKFRTMHHHMTDRDAETLTQRGDMRVTRVGRFLRRTSLDELPQLINVVLGDMSLVGPRPHATAAKAEGRLYDQAVQSYAARHRVKPGITGWAQVNGWRGETDTIEKIKRRVECDLYYIDNWSLGFDLWILLRTAIVVLRGDEAY